MKPTFALLSLLFLAAADARQPLLGHWTGTSLCTGIRPACHDETASYRIKAGPSNDVVTIDLDKVVDGNEERMGTLDFKIDYSTHSLTGVMERNGRWVWSFQWSGDTMTGTLKSADGQAVRNVRITKQAK